MTKRKLTFMAKGTQESGPEAKFKWECSAVLTAEHSQGSRRVIGDKPNGSLSLAVFTETLVS